MAMGNPPPPSSSFVLLVAFLLVSATSLAIAINLGINLDGSVHCTKDGNPSSGGGSGGAANANVSLTCDGGRSTIARALTNAQGTFSIRAIVPVSVVLPLVEGECKAIVGLPAANCSSLPRNGTLQATVRVAKIQLGSILLATGPWSAH